MKKETLGAEVEFRGWQVVSAGFDSHKNYSAITVKNAQGKEMVRQENLPNNGGIIKLFQGVSEPWQELLKLAVGGIGYGISQKKNCFEAKLSQLLGTETITSAKVKTDTIAPRSGRTQQQLILFLFLTFNKDAIALKKSCFELLRFAQDAVFVKIYTGPKNRVHAMLARNNMTEATCLEREAKPF